MNVFICSTERPFHFFGRCNDDVNMYLLHGSRGERIGTTPFLAINQVATQSQSGGLTDMYLELGTYVKSFYSVMMMPSCVKIHLIGLRQKRLHHRISWNNAAPKILHEKYKKVNHE